MSGRAAILHASVTLAHVPDMVRYGSKPSRERMRFAELAASLRSFADAVRYPPHQVFVGNVRPEALWELPRPRWRYLLPESSTDGVHGHIIDQTSFYELLAEVDRADLVTFEGKPDPSGGDLALYEGETVVGTFHQAHESDEALSARVLLENLACKATAVQALRDMLTRNSVEPASLDYVIGCGEEAVGDRYQRGGGSLGKAVAESCGAENASGSDVKAFCAGPVNALVIAAALVGSGACERVAVVAGGSLAKLGMKFLGALRQGTPILEDMLAGMAVLVGRGDGPCVRLDAVGRHRVGSGSSQQALLEDVVVRPLETLGMGFMDIDRYATELHDPEITEPAGGGDVASRNYRLLGGLATLRGDIAAEDVGRFARLKGMPGFSPTQGHIASAIPWLPHALQRFAAGELRSTMLLAKGSLFLGRMTQMWDGISVTLEV